LPNLQFALNHYQEPDVALFDFTSMFASGKNDEYKYQKELKIVSWLVVFVLFTVMVSMIYEDSFYIVF
jgi:hypothetical protein